MKYLLPLCILALSTNLCLAKTHEVIVSSNIFTPSSLVIEAGDTVRWRNIGGGHNVFATDGSFRCAEGCESEGGNGDPSTNLWQSEITFREPGLIAYICQPHISFGMQGSITVIEPTSVQVHEVHATTANDFQPSELTINQGEVIRFINDGGVHNINSADNTLICSEGCVGDGINLETNPTGFPWDIYVRFNDVTEIPYFCANHEQTGIGGIITVVSEIVFIDGFE
jgi:plastocyanin